MAKNYVIYFVKLSSLSLKDAINEEKYFKITKWQIFFKPFFVGSTNETYSTQKLISIAICKRTTHCILSYKIEITLENCARTEMSKTDKHQIGEHFDVVMVIQTILNVLEELEDVNPIKARVK